MPGFKDQALEPIKHNDLPKLAKGLPESTLFSWRTKDEQSAGQAFEVQKFQQTGTVHLKQEVARLQEELEFLKKAAANFELTGNSEINDITLSTNFKEGVNLPPDINGNPRASLLNATLPNPETLLIEVIAQRPLGLSAFEMVGTIESAVTKERNNSNEPTENFAPSTGALIGTGLSVVVSIGFFAWKWWQQHKRTEESASPKPFP